MFLSYLHLFSFLCMFGRCTHMHVLNQRLTPSVFSSIYFFWGCGLMASNPQRVKVQILVSTIVGIKCRSSRRSASTLNIWAISLALLQLIFENKVFCWTWSTLVLLDWLASKPMTSTCFYLLSIWDYRHKWLYLAFSCGCWTSKLKSSYYVA